MSSRRKTRRPVPVTALPAPVTAGARIRMTGRTRLRSIVAAAKRITVEKIKRGSTGVGWQSEAIAMYDSVGELRFVTNSIAGAMSLAELNVIKRNPDGGWDKIEDENDPAVAAMNVLFGDSPTGQSEMLRRFGQHLFVAGETYLIGHPADDERGGDHTEDLTSMIDPMAAQPEPGVVGLESLCWRVYSSVEVSGEGDTLKINDLEYDGTECVVIRMWRPHPRRSTEADSPVRSSLPVLRELIGLTMHVSATIDSRLAGAGMLILPQGATALGASAPEETDEGDDPFMAAVMEAMITPIKDRDSASAVVPIIVTVPDEIGFQPQHITFGGTLDGVAKELRDEAIRRLALGLDCPPERLLGLGSGSNHWTAWQIAEEEAKLHIAPPLAIIRDTLTREFLRVILEASGVENPQDYAIEADLTALYLRPDRSKDAFELHARKMITDKVLREACGFGEEDAPEIVVDLRAQAVALALDMLKAAPSLAQAPGLPDLVAQIMAVLDPAGAEAEGTAAQDTETPDEEEPEGEPEGTENGPPETKDDEPPAGEPPGERAA